MKILRFILFPFSIIYGCLAHIRNKLFDCKIVNSEKFQIPIISVGNISTGGTGKTPHIEYLIRLLRNEFVTATLSRGYGRKTKGFRLVYMNDSAENTGDEPLQFKNKFVDITVAVDERRLHGIKKILELNSNTNLVLLDDAFQHRAVHPGFSILLTEYSNLYCTDFVLPTGNLREFKSGAKRADSIVVTKCPATLSEIEKAEIRNKLAPLKHQQLYFSFIRYGEIVSFSNHHQLPIHTEDYSALLFTGIANSDSLEKQLSKEFKQVKVMKFPDHHQFTKSELKNILKIFTTIASEKKILITTEKDWMRLKSIGFSEMYNNFPFYYLPIEVDFASEDKSKFNSQLIEYARRTTTNNKLH